MEGSNQAWGPKRLSGFPRVVAECLLALAELASGGLPIFIQIPDPDYTRYEFDKKPVDQIKITRSQVLYSI